MEWLNNL